MGRRDEPLHPLTEAEGRGQKQVLDCQFWSKWQEGRPTVFHGKQQLWDTAQCQHQQQAIDASVQGVEGKPGQRVDVGLQEQLRLGRPRVGGDRVQQAGQARLPKLQRRHRPQLGRGGADLLGAGVQERAAGVRLPHLRPALGERGQLPVFSRGGGGSGGKRAAGKLREEREGEDASKSWEGFRAGERVLPAAGWGEIMGRKRSTPKVPTLVPTGPA